MGTLVFKKNSKVRVIDTTSDTETSHAEIMTKASELWDTRTVAEIEAELARVQARENAAIEAGDTETVKQCAKEGYELAKAQGRAIKEGRT